MNLWWGESTRGGDLASAGRRGGLPSILKVEKTLSIGFILKIILHRVVGFN